jgi:hypothetical protein
MKRPAALCALALIGFAGLAESALADKGGDPGPPSQPPGHSGSAPGQQKNAQSPAPTPNTPAAHAGKPAVPAQQGNAHNRKPKLKTASASSHAKVGKITICHRTGSQKNPWVQITVSANAWKAHQKHGDLNPVPAGGCPNGGQPGAGGGGGGGGGDKITICHRTGSEQNPWVQITVSENAWSAHQKHGDLKPVPAGGCPGGGGPGGPGGGGDHDKITICHRTGSEQNPWVQITISENAWSAHKEHGDLNPVPGGGCPAGPTGRTTTTTTTTTASVAAVASRGPTIVSGQVAAVAPPQAAGPSTTGQPGSSQGPAQQSAPVRGQPGTVSAPRIATERESEKGVLDRARDLGSEVQQQNLPFTGLPLWIVMLAGAGLAGAGLGIRRWGRPVGDL